MAARQGDLFLNEEADLDDDRPTPVFRADPDKVRQKLHKLLAEAKVAQTLPWDEYHTGLHQITFPQMANWLPDDEAAELRAAFAAELVRLGA